MSFVHWDFVFWEIFSIYFNIFSSAIHVIYKITIEIELKLVDNPRARLLFTSEMVDWQKAKNENWFRKTIECWSPRGRRKRIEERSKARPQSQSCSKSPRERTFFVGLQYLKFQYEMPCCTNSAVLFLTWVWPRPPFWTMLKRKGWYSGDP